MPRLLQGREGASHPERAARSPFASVLAVGAVLAGLAACSCATPAVLERWRAHDAVRRVRFRLHDAHRDDPELSWRVESEGLSDRRGTISLPGAGQGCDRLTLESADGPLAEGASSRRLIVPLERIANPPEPPLHPGPPSDCTIVVDLLPGSGRAAPRFDLRRRGTSIVQIETPPPRSGGWLALVPVAVVADAPLAAAGLAVLPIAILPALLVGLDDFSWVPGQSVKWHRRSSDEKRTKGER